MSIWTYLAPLGLVLDVVNRTDLGFDVLEVRQWLVNDAQLFGCSRRGFWRCSDDGHFLFLGQQAERSGGARCVGGTWSTAGVAGRGSRGDGSGPGRAGCGGATAGRAGPSSLYGFSENRNDQFKCSKSGSATSANECEDDLFTFSHRKYTEETKVH